ncbi:MAG: class I SAM-dependent methyltransferase [Armatimonadetes bacterium]|nr:class I SAM-dependent methyltransferase [Armatimonadota bacterium]
MDDAPFKAIAPYYDQLMDGIPYLWWYTYLVTLLDCHDAAPERVLELGCGTGNLTEYFCLNEYDVTGVDISSEMIEIAKNKARAGGLAIDYYAQDAAELCLDAKFDLVFSVFDSLNNITEPDRMAQCFARVAQHLSSNGLFIFDLNTELAFARKMFDQRYRRKEAKVRYDWRSAYDRKTRLCRIQMKFTVKNERNEDVDFEETHIQRAYSDDEINRFLNDAGFHEIASYDAYSLRRPNKRSDRVFYVARKP